MRADSASCLLCYVVVTDFMLKPFFFSWLIYWGLIFILPVHSLYPSVALAFLLQVVFVILA